MRPAKSNTSVGLAALLTACGALAAETSDDISADAIQPADIITEAEQEETEQLDAETDGSIVDVKASIEDSAGKLGLSVGGDLRATYAFEDRDRRDLSSVDADLFGARWRLETGWVITDYLRAVGGAATASCCRTCWAIPRRQAPVCSPAT